MGRVIVGRVIVGRVNGNQFRVPYDKNCPPFDDLVNSFKALFSKVFKPVISIQSSKFWTMS